MSKSTAINVTLVTTGVLAGLFMIYKYIFPGTTTVGEPKQDNIAHIPLSKDERYELQIQFELATQFMNSKHGKAVKPDQKTQLKFYALFKTVTQGDNDTPKPSLIDFQRNAMWNAWNDLRGMPREQAMIEYVELVHSLDPEWREKVVSPALYNVLGENATLPENIEPDEDEQQDQDVDLSYNLDETERQRHERQLKANEERKLAKQKQLEHKYRNLVGIEDTADDDTIKQVENDKLNGDKSSQNPMGFVFSTAQAENSDDDDDNYNNPHTAPAKDNDGNDAEDTTPSTIIIPAQPTETNGETSNQQYIYLHRCPSKYNLNELMEVHDRTVISAFIEKMTSEIQNSNHDTALGLVFLLDTHGTSLLHHAADAGFIDGVKLLVEECSYPIDLTDPYESTPLMTAIAAEQYDVVEYLIHNGANIHHKDCDGVTVKDKLDECDNLQFKQKVNQLLNA